MCQNFPPPLDKNFLNGCRNFVSSVDNVKSHKKPTDRPEDMNAVLIELDHLKWQVSPDLDNTRISSPEQKEIKVGDTCNLELQPVESSSIELDKSAISNDKKLERKMPINNKFIISNNMDKKQWISFTCTQSTTESDLQEWLENNHPSNPCYKDVGWISIDWDICEVKDKSENVEQARQLWEKASEKTFQTITEIAKNTDILDGKWNILVPSDNDSANMLWNKVAMAIWSKRFGTNILRAKVSTFWEDSTKYSIQIYTENFLFKEEVLSCEQQLRKLEIFSKLHYKPEILTALGINSNEHQNIVPSLCISDYDLSLQKSKILNSKGNAIEM